MIIVFAGPLVSVLHSSKVDPSVLEIWIGGLAVAIAVLWMFRYHIAALVGSLRSRYGRIEEDIAYPALPPGPLLEDAGYYDEQETRQEMVSQDTADDEFTLLLAPGCPLPFSSALTPHLILERPGIGRRGRAVATRKYLELLHGGIPILLVTANPSYATLLPVCSNGWLAGSPEGKARGSAKTEGRYAVVTKENAANFSAKVLRSVAQVVLDISSYADEVEALGVVSAILAGMWAIRGTCAGLIVFTDADKWAPDNTMLIHGRTGTDKGAIELAQTVRDQLYEMISTDEATGLIVYLSTPSLYHMDLRSVRGCRLWTLNMPFSQLSPGDIAFICHHSGMTEAQLAHLNECTILVDVDSRTLMEIQMYMHQTAHEERSAPTDEDLDLSQVPALEVARLGKAGAGTDREGDARRGGGSVPAATEKSFTWQQYAYAVALQQAGHLTETALRRPPSTKTIGNTPITCADLAQELGLKQPFSDKDLMGQDRAAELLDILEGRSQEKLTKAELGLYEARASQALAAVAERRGSNEAAAFSAQPGEGTQSAASSRWPQPALSLLIAPESVKPDVRNEVNARGRALQETLTGFGVAAQVMEEYTSIGPKVVRFGVLPTGKDDRRTKVEQITRLERDIQRVLQAKTIRMMAPVPGTPYVGIEIPNSSPWIVRLREILESAEYQFARAKSSSKLIIALGRDVAGKIRFFDLSKAPHVLIGGASGSGKSVCVNTILGSLLMGTTPEDVRLVLVDPKKVELSFYNGIPYLLGPVITDVSMVAPMLRTMIAQMQERYKLFASLEVRDLDEYRLLRAERRRSGDYSLQNIPAYVVLIDELANIMLAEKDEVEPLLCDLIALGRAAGIHLILATQRPVVEVVTGNIKAQMPTRIGFMVAQANDSRIILDQGGAETLLGKGDMLFLSEEITVAERIQCALTETTEAKRLTQYWKQAKPLREGEVEPIDAAHIGQLPLQEWAPPAPEEDTHGVGQGSQLETLIEAFLNGEQLGLKLSDLETEQLYRFVQPWTGRQTLVSNQDLMFTFGIGQPRAAKLMTWLQRDGIVGPDRGAGRKREVLANQEVQPVETPV
jgi:hypothetical protein